MVKKASHTTEKLTGKRVDYYPNRVGLAVAAAAAISLVILGAVAVYM
jgi:hypothetical protein